MLIEVDFKRFELSTNSPNALNGYFIYLKDYSKRVNPSNFFRHRPCFYYWHNKHRRSG